MKSKSLEHWTIGLLFLSLICIDLFAPCTFAAESKKSQSALADAKTGETKVKCKKHIEEALKKHWDQEKGEYVTKEQLTRKLADSIVDVDDDDDDESDEDNTEEDNVTVEEVDKKSKDAQTEEDKTEEDDDDDDDDVDDEDDDDDPEDETNETVEDATVEEKEPETPPKKMIGRLDTKKDAPAKRVETTTTPKPITVGRISTTQRTTTTTSTTTTTTPPPKTTVKRVTTTVAPKRPAVTTTTSTKAPTTKLMKGRLPPKTTPAPIVEEDSQEDDADSLEEYKSRSQVEEILKLYEIGTKEDAEEQNLITSTFKDLKRIYEASIKPLEALYKYKFISNRVISDAEIFSKPMVLFLGSKASGKTSLVNYLLGLDSTPWQIRTGLTAAPPHFTIVEHGDQFTKLSPMEISADFAFSNLQQFGQHFVESHLEAFRMPLSILQKVTIVDSPGLVDGNVNKAPEPGKSIDSEVYQWFVDRADIIFICIESSQVQVTQALKDLLEQLKGRDVRFIITKAESLSQTQAVMLMGQLLWSLSPLMPIDRPPQVYALTTIPQEEFNPFLDQQEQEWLQDLSQLLTGVSRVESRSSAVRRHAVRVRNHAKVIDCYIGAYNRRKPLFSFGGSGKKLAQDITENPHNYNIFKGVLAGITQNVSRYDLPDPDIYREFFKVNHLLDFKQLSATCSFFAGCPIDKLDIAIAYKIPDLVSKYKKATRTLKKNKTPSSASGGKKK